MVCENWPPPHSAPYPGCVGWADFLGHMNAQAEAAYKRGQADAAAGVTLAEPWLYVHVPSASLAQHIADSKAWFTDRARGTGRRGPR